MCSCRISTCASFPPLRSSICNVLPSKYFPKRQLKIHTERRGKSPITGASLIELCVVILLITGGALYVQPQLRSFIEDNRAITLTNHLISLLHYSRFQALVHQQSITLCQLEAAICQKPWRRALTLFVDQAPIGRLDDTDKILLTSELPAPLGVIHWRSFRRKPYIHFTPLGGTRSQNGHFVICIAAGASGTARKVVINRQGRTRLEGRINASASKKRATSNQSAKRC